MTAYLRRSVAAGGIAGAVLAYLGMVGMVEEFNGVSLVGSWVTLGRVMIALPPLVAGFVLSRPRVVRGRIEKPAPAVALTGGLVAGALASLVTIAAIALAKAIGVQSVRGIFVSVSPELIAVYLFHHAPVAGGALLLAFGAALGFAGAGVRLVPPEWRRPVVAGLFAVLVLSLLQRLVPPALIQLGISPDWLYSPVTLGLTATGAAIVMVAVAAITWAYRRYGRPLLAGGGDEAAFRPHAPRGVRAASTVLAVAFFAVLPLLLGSALSQKLDTVGIFLLMGLGLNIVVGHAGLLDLGYVAFFAVGAYLTAMFTGASIVQALGSSKPALPLHLNFYAALPLVILCAAFIGLLIGAPVLRLRGDYLAIVTLGFGEIARVLVASDWLRNRLGGSEGLQGVTAASIGGISFRDPKNFYYLVLVLAVVAMYVSHALSRSRIGRAWNALREDEQTAEIMGVSTVRYKLLAFAIGGAIGCLSGALFAVQIGSLAPTSFNVLVSITALAIVIMGGMGSIRGVLLGALALVGIPQVLNQFQDFQLLIYGAVLIAIMILRPQGLIPNVRRSRELHESERAQDAWFRRSGDASVDAEIAVAGGPDA